MDGLIRRYLGRFGHACLQRRYPGNHYVVIDDKLNILTAVKKVWRARVTTVFPRQGHYARDPHLLKSYPPPDVSNNRIGDVLRYDLPQLVGAGDASAREPWLSCSTGAD